MTATDRMLNVPSLRHWYRTRNLRWRLLTILGVIFLLTLVLIGTSVYLFVYQNEKRTWQDRQGAAVRNANDTIVAFIERVEDTLRLAGSWHRHDLISNPQIMPRLLEQNPAVLELVRLDPQGRALPGSYQDAPILADSADILQSPWYTRAKSGNVYLGAAQISAEGEPFTIMAVPTPDGGVVAARLRLNLLWDLVAGLNFGQTGQSYVINSAGQIVAHTEPGYVLDGTSLSGRPELMAVQKASDQQWSGSYRNFEGNDVIGVSAAIEGTDWVIITEVTKSEAFATSRTALALLVAGLGLVGLLVMVVTSRFLGKLIIQPMEKLQAGAFRLGRGDLSHRLKVDPYKQDVVSQVAAAFNEMGSRLHDRDIQLAQQTQALRESEERFRQVASSISDHVYMSEIRADGQYVNHYIAPNVVDLTGYPYENFAADWSFWPTRVIHPDDRAEAAAQAKRFAQGQSSEMEYRMVRADGRMIWVRDSGQIRRDPDSQSIYVFGVVSDITDRKQAEEEISRARDQALEANAFKSRLLANVSHDLRTPLGAILGYTEILHEGMYGHLTPDQREITRRLIRSIRNLSNMVSDLLDQAKLENRRLALIEKPFDLYHLVDGLYATMQVLAENKGIRLTCDIATDLPQTMYGDADQLQRILNNLVGNAIKFTERGSVKVRVYRADLTQWALEVADTGPGIPKEAQSYIFEPFRQIDGSLTRGHGGSGLGLSIVKQLADLMGGEVRLESKEGYGSTFTVLLPLTTIQEIVS